VTDEEVEDEDEERMQDVVLSAADDGLETRTIIE
jgi:DNA-binding protein YbaB